MTSTTRSDLRPYSYALCTSVFLVGNLPRGWTQEMILRKVVDRTELLLPQAIQLPIDMDVLSTSLKRAKDKTVKFKCGI
jgi:hypothetical protein